MIMNTEQRIEKLERQQQRLVACVMTMAGVVLELAERELGGPGPIGLTGGEVASKGLQMLGRYPAPCRTGAEAIERAVQVLRLLADEPEREGTQSACPSRPTEESNDD